MSPNRRNRFRWNLWWLAALAVAAPGCDDQRRHRATHALEFAAERTPLPPDAAPEEVVRALLTALRDAQHAREQGLGDKEHRNAYAGAMGRLSGLAARRAIHERMIISRSPALPVDLGEAEALTITTESWVSIAAYYVDGILLDTLAVKARGSNMIAYTVQAERPEDRARLLDIEAAGGVGGANDRDAGPGSEAGADRMGQIRSRALAMDPAFNVPIRVQIEVRLQREENAWRVHVLALGPVSAPPSTRP